MIVELCNVLIGCTRFLAGEMMMMMMMIMMMMMMMMMMMC